MQAKWLILGSEILMLAAVLIWLFRDVVVAFLGRRSKGATEPWTLYKFSKRYPMIPFVVGAFCGHFLGTLANGDVARAFQTGNRTEAIAGADSKDDRADTGPDALRKEDPTEGVVDGLAKADQPKAVEETPRKTDRLAEVRDAPRSRDEPKPAAAADRKTDRPAEVTDALAKADRPEPPTVPARKARKPEPEVRLNRVFVLRSAVVNQDGRTITLSFAGPRPDRFGAPDWMPGAAAGARLVARPSGTLEHLGTYTIPRDRTGLIWTAVYLVTDPDQVITAGQSNVTLTAPAALLRDRYGNATADFSAVVATNRSLVRQDGFVVSPPNGRAGVSLYVSSSHGSDAHSFNQARSMSTPYATIGHALQQAFRNAQHGKGAHVKLLRGDTFTSGGGIQTGGQDAGHPFCLETYWNSAYGADPRTRPVVAIDASPSNTGQHQALFSNGGGKTPNPLNYVMIRGIAFKAVNTTVPGAKAEGLFFLQPGKGWTIANCSVSNFNNNVVMQSGTFDQVALIRNIITDSWGGQGILMDHVSGLLVSQCTIDRNGHTEPDHTGANVFLHNLYIQKTCGPAIVWGNQLSNAGSHGCQMRPGGVLAYNYLGGNAIAAFVGGIGGAAYKNVVEASGDINLPNDPRGFGLEINGELGPLAETFEFNVIVNAAGHQNQAIQLKSGETLKDGLIRHNTCVKGGLIYLQHIKAGAADSLVVDTANVFDAGSYPCYYLDASITSAWYRGDENALDSTARHATNIGPLTLWSNQARGVHEDSRFGPIKYQDPKASLEGYQPGLLDLLRARKPGAWPAVADPLPLYRYFAKAFTPTNLPELGSGPFDYYGANDYRAPGA